MYRLSIIIISFAVIYCVTISYCNASLLSRQHVLYTSGNLELRCNFENSDTVTWYSINFRDEIRYTLYRSSVSDRTRNIYLPRWYNDEVYKYFNTDISINIILDSIILHSPPYFNPTNYICIRHDELGNEVSFIAYTVYTTMDEYESAILKYCE